MKRIGRHEVGIELVGGLGNQLFGYFFGIHISKILDLRPRFFYTSTSISVGRPSSISEFRLEHPIELRARRNFDFVTFRKLAHRAMSLASVSSSTAERLARLHASRGIGEDEGEKSIRPGQLVTGYFQAHKYFKEVSKGVDYQPLELANPSTWFLKVNKEIVAQRPIVVHVRRGDYNDPINRGIGLLDENYYLESIARFREFPALKDTPIWLFSDDVRQVRNEFPTLSSQVSFWARPPKDSTPAESMILMSRADGMVISNSTFSWWAANLGGVPEVIAPEKWFRLQEDPNGLIPQRWMRSPSYWKP
jgi:hypothetical protein